jgi:hypothetical protein
MTVSFLALKLPRTSAGVAANHSIIDFLLPWRVWRYVRINSGRLVAEINFFDSIRLFAQQLAQVEIMLMHLHLPWEATEKVQRKCKEATSGLFSLRCTFPLYPDSE